MREFDAPFGIGSDGNLAGQPVPRFEALAKFKRAGRSQQLASPAYLNATTAADPTGTTGTPEQVTRCTGDLEQARCSVRLGTNRGTADFAPPEKMHLDHLLRVAQLAPGNS